ncbi:hypothetical protein L1D11_11000 [Vibrio sp. Isolate32]|uniref:hypothetical protein n=1 Tax=Vibrio sp. Isolate32 TaxID=2908538 RepID=UPI001EFCBED8|nr:hypothetical protein [Vibrio sp. Isolate32]MCG9553887.1 hypothetical protein [Vibrio sp. Isolate32]
MKAIVSLFISAYQPGMASIECRPCSFNQSLQPLFFSDSDGSGQVLSYEAGDYKESQMEGCDFNEDECGDVASYQDLCWMISRARRSQPLGYYVMYLRYVSHQPGYAKTVGASLRQHIARHPNLKDSLSTSLITWLQQHEDLFCQTLQQQLIEFHTSR